MSLRNSFPLLAIALLVLFSFGCGSGNNQNTIVPPTGNHQTPQPQGGVTDINQRILWGLWKIDVSDNHQDAAIHPLRTGDFHFNVLKMIENQPLTKCLTIDSINTADPKIIEIYLTLWHPFPGNYNLTGFDVRGIFITKADYYFPENVRNIAWSDSYPLMADYDGYTNFFNPTQFPESPGTSPLLTYVTGDLATGTNLTSTLNPYIAYREDAPRRAFMPGDHETKRIRFYAPDGAFSFGYAVSACWTWPGKTVTDPIIDFPPDANSPEPYQIDTSIWPGIEPTPGSESSLFVSIFDHQGLDTLLNVTAECPELFSGTKSLDYLSTDEDDGSHLYSTTISNGLGATIGYYPLLIRVDDTGSDPNFGPATAWTVAALKVGFGWARAWGPTYFDMGGGLKVADIAAVNNGDSVVLGSNIWSGDYDMDPGPAIAPVDGGRDTLSRFDPRGKLDWVVDWERTDSSYSGVSGYASADSMGNTYVADSFYDDKIDFDPGPGEAMYSSGSGWSGYLSKFDPDGNFIGVKIWTSPHSGTESHQFRPDVLLINNNDEIILSGEFRGSIDFDPGPYDFELSSEDYAYFMTKLDSNGNLIWATNLDQVDSGYTAVDTSGQIYSTYYFKGTIDLDPGPGEDLYTAIGDQDDIFMRIFDSDGDYVKGMVWGNENADWVSDSFFSPTQNMLYILGYFYGTIDFDPGPGVHEETSAEYTTYISRFDTQGNFVDVSILPTPDFSRFLVTESGNIVLGGTFTGTVDLDPGPAQNLAVSHGKADAFLIILDPSFNYVFGTSWGTVYKDEIPELATNGQAVFIGGDFKGILDLDPTKWIFESVPLSPDSTYGYLMKLLADGSW